MEAKLPVVDVPEERARDEDAVARISASPDANRLVLELDPLLAEVIPVGRNEISVADRADACRLQRRLIV